MPPKNAARRTAKGPDGKFLQTPGQKARRRLAATKCADPEHRNLHKVKSVAELACQTDDDLEEAKLIEDTMRTWERLRQQEGMTPLQIRVLHLMQKQRHSMREAQWRVKRKRGSAGSESLPAETAEDADPAEKAEEQPERGREI